METTGCRPTASQELLLRAALLRGDASHRAWEAWRADADIDRLDSGSFRLLPLLYRSLTDQGIEDPLRQRLKGVYRQTWYKNQLLIGGVLPVLRSLHAAGVKTLLLKGAALTSLYYRDDGLRPMNDLDLLVPLSQATRAVTAMQALGWTISPGGVLPTPAALFLEKSREMRSPSGMKLDLHWHVMEQWFEPEREVRSDASFWQGALPMEFRGIPTSALCATDLLLHICVHATEGQPDVPPVRWVADALAILNSPHAEVSWDRLLLQARTRRVSLPLREALSYLVGAMDAPVPREVLRGLEAIPTTREQRWEYAAWTVPPLQRAQLERRRHPAITLRRHCRRYARWAWVPGRPMSEVSPLCYLQHVWCLDSPWRIPLAVLSRALQKLPAAARPRPRRPGGE